MDTHADPRLCVLRTVHTAGIRTAQVMHGCFGKTFSCNDARCELIGRWTVRTTTTCTNTYAMYFIVDHDLLTPFDTGGVARTREIRFTTTRWHDGLHAGHKKTGQPSSNTMPSCTTTSLACTSHTPHLRVEHAQEHHGDKSGFHLILMGIKTVFILLAAHLKIWGIDYYRVNSAREAMITRDVLHAPRR